MLVDAYGRPFRQKLSRGTDVFFGLPQIEALSAWDVQKLKDALQAHEVGDFTNSGRLYWAMMTDPRVSDGVNKRALALRGVPYEIRPGRGRGARQLAAVLRRAFGFTDRGPTGPNRVTPPATVTELFGQALLLGGGLANPKWQNEEHPELNNNDGVGWAVPQLRSWEPTLSRWLPTAFNDEIDGGHLVTIHRGSVKGKPADSTEPAVAGDGTWLHFILAGDRRWWMQGKIRAVGRPWVSRLLKALFWLRFDEVHGMPFRIAKVPHGMKKTPETQRLFNSLKNIGREPTFLAPQAADGKSGVDIDLKEATSESWKSFEQGLIYWGTEITILLTGGTMNTEALGGNYEGARQQQEIRHEVKAADALAWATCVNTQLCRPFAVLNGFAPEAAPEVVYDVRPPVNKKAAAEASAAEFKAVQEACRAHAALEARGIVVPLVEFLAERGLQLPAGAQVGKPKPARPRRGAAPPPDEDAAA